MKYVAKSLLILIALAATTTTFAQTLPTFQHIIVLIQENRTPDNLFGSNPTFTPGVDIQTPSSGQWCLGACFDPATDIPIGRANISTLDHVPALATPMGVPLRARIATINWWVRRRASCTFRFVRSSPT